MFAYSVDVSTHNIDSDFTNSVGGTVDSGTTDCIMPFGDPVLCKNGSSSSMCECKERYYGFIYWMIYQYFRTYGQALPPLMVLVDFPNLFRWRRIEYVKMFLAPIVYPVLRPFLPENKTIENMLFISVPSILQWAMFCYLTVMFLLTSNSVSKRFKSTYAVYGYNHVDVRTDIHNHIPLLMMAGLLIEAIGIYDDFICPLPSLDGRRNTIILMGWLQDPLFYPNVLMFARLALVTQVAVIVVFAVDSIQKEINPDIPPNLNKQILAAQIITFLTGNFGAFVASLDLWELWPIFVFLTVAEPFLFWALAIAFYGDEKMMAERIQFIRIYN